MTRSLEDRGIYKTVHCTAQWGLTFRTNPRDMAKSQIPKWTARNDSKGVSCVRPLSIVPSVSDRNSRTRGNREKVAARVESLQNAQQ